MSPLAALGPLQEIRSSMGGWSSGDNVHATVENMERGMQLVSKGFGRVTIAHSTRNPP